MLVPTHIRARLGVGSEAPAKSAARRRHRPGAPISRTITGDGKIGNPDLFFSEGGELPRESPIQKTINESLYFVFFGESV